MRFISQTMGMAIQKRADEMREAEEARQAQLTREREMLRQWPEVEPRQKKIRRASLMPSSGKSIGYAKTEANPKIEAETMIYRPHVAMTVQA